MNINETALGGFSFGYENVQQQVSVWRTSTGGARILHTDNGKTKEWSVDCTEELEAELDALYEHMKKQHLAAQARFGAYLTDVLDAVHAIEHPEDYEETPHEH